MEGWRNPARYIVPLALAASVAATYLIVHHALSDKHSSTTTSTVLTTSTVAHGHSNSGSGSSKAKFYVVKSGDSLSGIASKTGVSMATIERLNPHLNPNALQPSQRLRLRR
ncbi:MAG TPA: LysM domain-containing protein [Solirubrobacteraceae bacterium]|nr:LysM domain-containing protein [Solirubrobacteraceae bacterium]